jgi:hypothetical protein
MGIYNTRETIRESSPATNPAFSRVYREFNIKYNSLFLFRFKSSYIVSNPCVSRLPRCYEKEKAL